MKKYSPTLSKMISAHRRLHAFKSRPLLYTELIFQINYAHVQLS